MRRSILVTLDYFLPGFKAGGPARTIANLIEHLGAEADFRIITRDRDLEDERPYPGIQPDCWTEFGSARVYYASPTSLTFRKLTALIRSTPHDVLYLNSLFSPRMTQVPLLARRLGMLEAGRRWVLAPRGELGAGALRIKSAKKRLWLAAGKAFGLVDDIVWQASTELEANDIRAAFPNADPPIVACDLPTHFSPAERDRSRLSGEPLRIVFLARIVPIKNLHFALAALAKVRVPVRFDIYGPLEDAEYWNRCQALMKRVPGHVEVRYRGAIEPDAIHRTLSAYDVFFLPSGGENFGHVMSEALQAGLPLLISDQTPWQNLRQYGVGHSLPLTDEEPFVRAIEHYAGMNAADWHSVAANVRRYVESLRASTAEAVASSRRLFGLPSPAAEDPADARPGGSAR
ncbi:MAG: glycosyltransferase [Cypionkella sp.]